MFDRKKLGDKELCPLLKAPCAKHECRWYVHLVGKNPQGGDIDHYGCAVEWLPIMLTEVAQKELQTGAAVEARGNATLAALEKLTAETAKIWAATEAFRNEVVAIGRRIRVLPPPPAGAPPESRMLPDDRDRS